MIRKYGIPLLALAGVIFAVFVVRAGMKKTPVAPPATQPVLSPFERSIAGAGLVEASSRNIAVGSTASGVVTHLTCKVGDQVKAGDPLFALDDRALQAELTVRQAALAAAEARVRTAQANLQEATAMLQRYDAIDDPRAVSKEERDRRFFARESSDALLAQARADVATAKAQIDAAQTDIALRTVRALVDGEVLQVNIRPGEFVFAGLGGTPPVLMGNTQILHVRVDIDENDAWRIDPGAAAVAAVRGNRNLKADLRFVRIEPYVVPKRSLTGESTERVDTRVLQVLYAFPHAALPNVYVGQQMDVWIRDTGEAGAAAAAARSAATRPATVPAIAPATVSAIAPAAAPATSPATAPAGAGGGGQ